MDSELDRTHDEFNRPCPEFEDWVDEWTAQVPDPELKDFTPFDYEGWSAMINEPNAMPGPIYCSECETENCRVCGRCKSCDGCDEDAEGRICA